MSSVAFGMIDRDAFGDRVQQHRLAGARRRDDQRALPVADRRDQIDGAPRELGAALRRRPVSSVSFRSGYVAVSELKSGRRNTPSDRRR